MDLRRWASSDTNRIRASAQKVVGLQPDIIVTDTTPATVAVQRETRSIALFGSAVLCNVRMFTQTRSTAFGRGSFFDKCEWMEQSEGQHLVLH